MKPKCCPKLYWPPIIERMLVSDNRSCASIIMSLRVVTWCLGVQHRLLFVWNLLSSTVDYWP